MKARLALLPGDGIGPEVCAAAASALAAVAARHGHQFEFDQHLIGGAAIDANGEPLPAATRAACLAADAVLLGAVGGPRWSDPAASVRPEQGLLALRSAMGVYANLRPLRLHPSTAALSPLKPERLQGVDLMFVRELTGGIYFGAKTRSKGHASDLCSYSEFEVERVVRVACRLARTRRGRICSVDKANVLETSRLWRSTTERVVHGEFPGLRLEHQLVDSMAMHLILKPAEFDVIVTENLFGDILTDEAAVLAGSLGLLPSASLGDGSRGLYEPVHGSAPDIAGQGVANPLGAILSGALLLRHSLGLENEAEALEQAVSRTLDAGVVTRDLAGPQSGYSTAAVTAAVVERLAWAGPQSRNSFTRSDATCAATR